MKSLEIVQKIAKVMYIICKVLFILTIIGTIGAAIGGIVLLIVPEMSEEVRSSIVSDFDIEDAASFGMTAIASSIIVLGECIILGRIKTYLKNELDDGTPFTHRGADEFLKLGITSIVVSICAAFIAMIILAIADVNEDIIFDANFTDGVMMILLSFVFKYGADLAEGKTVAINSEKEHEKSDI